MGAYAQSETIEQSNSKRTNKVLFGLESEIMTWINSGYHGSFWLGKNGKRIRLVVASATFPKYLNPEGFKNLTSDFYEIEFDYFFGKKGENLEVYGMLWDQDIRNKQLNLKTRT
jgi:hypothetical protein